MRIAVTLQASLMPSKTWEPLGFQSHTSSRSGLPCAMCIAHTMWKMRSRRPPLRRHRDTHCDTPWPLHVAVAELLHRHVTRRPDGLEVPLDRLRLQHAHRLAASLAIAREGEERACAAADPPYRLRDAPANELSAKAAGRRSVVTTQQQQTDEWRGWWVAWEWKLGEKE